MLTSALLYAVKPSSPGWKIDTNPASANFFTLVRLSFKSPSSIISPFLCSAGTVYGIVIFSSALLMLPSNPMTYVLEGPALGRPTALAVDCLFRFVDAPESAQAFSPTAAAGSSFVNKRVVAIGSLKRTLPRWLGRPASDVLTLGLLTLMRWFFSAVYLKRSTLACSLLAALRSSAAFARCSCLQLSAISSAKVVAAGSCGWRCCCLRMAAIRASSFLNLVLDGRRRVSRTWYPVARSPYPCFLLM